jgi:hypothetical protein
MPFTTLKYYTWLFDKDSSQVGTVMSHLTDENSAVLTESPSSYQVIDTSTQPAPLSEAYHRSQHLYGPQTESGLGHTSLEPGVWGLNSHISSTFNSILPQNFDTNSTGSIGHHDGKTAEASTHCEAFGAIRGYSMPTPTNSRSSQDFHTLPESRRSRKLPVVDEVARAGILRFVDQSHPKTPDGAEISGDSPQLQLPFLQRFSDLFFTRFNVSYPLLHRATFDPTRVDTLLLASILQLGATYSDKDDHLFAICLHNTMRGQIFANSAFNTEPPLWMLQTILLVECFGKSRAGQLQHDMSHLFHGLLIKYATTLYPYEKQTLWKKQY